MKRKIILIALLIGCGLIWVLWEREPEKVEIMEVVHSVPPPARDLKTSNEQAAKAIAKIRTQYADWRKLQAANQATLQKARATLESQSKILEDLESTEAAFDSGDLSAQQYLIQRSQIAAQIRDR